jgi:hypothetical protein
MRVKLSEKYQKQREDICNKILEILDLDHNNSILLYDLEKDLIKQNAILDMKDEIKQYFAVSCLTPFKPNATCKRPYINIIRGILRQQGYVFQGCNVSIKNENNILTRSMKYVIFRNK